METTAQASGNSLLANATVTPTVSTTDPTRSREFYGNTLGLNCTDSNTEENAFQVECGNGTSIYVYPRQDPPKAENTVASFNVNNFEEVVADLRNRGVTFEEYDFPGLKTENGVADLGGGTKAAWFKDPDGNILAVGTGTM